MELDLGMDDLFNDGDEQEEIEQKQQARALQTKNRIETRRIKNELALELMLPWHFEKNTSYHCISFGDVDSLSYLRAIIKQQKLEYCLLSTWCMSMNDAYEIEKWLSRKLINRIDFYVGEIFRNSYSDVYDKLVSIVKKYGGRVCIFRNHSKIIAGFGESFDFAIESNANINTNPRTENTTISVSTELALFYKDFFDSIIAFNKEFRSFDKFLIERKKEDATE